MQRIDGVTSELAYALEMVEAEVWGDWLDAAPPRIAEQLRIGVCRVGGAVAGAVPGADVLMCNRVVGLGIPDAASDVLIDELLAWYESADVSRWMVQWSPAAAPKGAPDLLRACGFYHHSNWMKLFRTARSPLPQAQTSLRVERVGGERREEFASILAAAFGFGKDIGEWCAAVVDRPGWRAYMSFDGDVPTGVGAWYHHGATAWLGFGATHPEQRQRGSQSALTVARLRDADALGCKLAVVETAEDRPDKPAPSFRNMRRLGFEVAYARANYVMVAGSEGTGIIAERTR